MVVDLGGHERTSRALHALADATRRDILARSLGRDHSISALAAQYPMSFAAVQKHVAVLERAGLVTKHRRGREQLIRGEIDSLRSTRRALEVLEDRWRARLERFGEVLADITKAETTKAETTKAETTKAEAAPADVTQEDRT